MMDNSLEARFWSKVIKTDNCWLWSGATSDTGYGVLWLGKVVGKNSRATHVSWYLHTGEWPKEWMLHICDNPACVNPSHLFEGSAQDNSQDMIKKGRGSKPPTNYGLDNINGKLTMDEVLEIRHLASKNLPPRRHGRIEFWTHIAEKYGVTRRYAQRLCSIDKKEVLRKVMEN